jgi:hypothetical protein
MAIPRLEGLDDRALMLEEEFLNVLRWGASQQRFPVADLGETEIVRDDKGKEERIRLRFGSIATAIWVPLADEEKAREFAAAVDAQR